MRRRALLAFLVALVALAAAVGAALVLVLAPTPTPTEPRVVTDVRIVVGLPRGARRAQSDGVANAVRLAVLQSGGAVTAQHATYRVEVVVADVSGPDGEWSEAAERGSIEAAAADASVVAYVGPGTLAAARLVAPVAAKAALAVVAPTLTHPALTKRGYDDALYAAVHPEGARVIARAIPSDDVGVLALLRWAKESGKVPPVARIDASAPYGAMLATAFAEALRELGLRDAAAAREAPKFVFVGGVSPESLAREVASAREAQPDVAIGGTEVLLADPFLARAGRSATGVAAVFVGRPVEAYEGPAGAFLRAYRDHYGAPPDPYAIFGFDAARLVLEAVRQAGADRAAVRDAVFGASVAGALGAWRVDASGDTTYAAVHRYAAASLPGDRVGWVWEGEIRAR